MTSYSGKCPWDLEKFRPLAYVKALGLERVPNYGLYIGSRTGTWDGLYVYVHFERAHFVNAKNQYATNITSLLRKLQMQFWVGCKIDKVGPFEMDVHIYRL